MPQRAEVSKPVTQTSGANAINIITLPALPFGRYALGQIFFSYSATPVSARVVIEDGVGNAVFDQYLEFGGLMSLHFDPAICGTEGNEMRVTITAGGTGVFSKLTVLYWTM